MENATIVIKINNNQQINNKNNELPRELALTHNNNDNAWWTFNIC